MKESGREAFSRTKEPSTKEINGYLERAVAEVFPKEFEHLQDDRFEHGFDAEGEKEGWKGLKVRVIMQGIVAGNLADKMGLSAEDKKALMQAAVLNMPMRRVQYKRYGMLIRLS